MTIATAAHAVDLAAECDRLRDENARLWALVEYLRDDTSAGYGRGRVRASYHVDAVSPIIADFGLVPLDI